MSKLIFDQSDIDRFFSHVEKLPLGCWFWTGARSRGAGNKKWYGSFWLKSSGVIRAHRFSCEAIGGKPPLSLGEHRDHLCQFSLCVNFECIEIVTHEENQRRKMERRAAFTSPSASGKIIGLR